ncbi:beta-hydroxyacyl-ACP dehydratase [Aquimarina addita]|uniref:Beta-hydroxyacyl-ACP dehydratase n=1 Tax=Aquimarina addita TaxID=870485 RepID=A0ABP6UP30_9FLAO
MEKELIIQKLPYTEPFLFVDKIIDIDSDGVTGRYTLRPDAYFYEGHFVGNPITPGVILTEIMAQIGVACLGIFLLNTFSENDAPGIAMSSNAIEFYKPVLPGETVTVVSEKEYFRFHKLKCKVALYNTEDKLIAKGVIAGMVLNHKDNK